MFENDARIERDHYRPCAGGRKPLIDLRYPLPRSGWAHILKGGSGPGVLAGGGSHAQAGNRTYLERPSGGARELRTYGAALDQGCSRAAVAMRKLIIQSLGSGTRALREYACRASTIWKTVHVSIKLRHVFPTILADDMQQNCVISHDSDTDNDFKYRCSANCLWVITLNEISRVKMGYGSH
eukprot:6207633-Pleurochrysis_carterae.AAC.1